MDTVYVFALIGRPFILAKRTVFGRLDRWCWANPNIHLRDLSIDGADIDRSDYHPVD